MQIGFRPQARKEIYDLLPVIATIRVHLSENIHSAMVFLAFVKCSQFLRHRGNVESINVSHEHTIMCYQYKHVLT